MPTMNLKKFWRRRKSVDITEYDPTYKVTYLGNVLTGWAKGEGCVEKPLATLWRNYCQSSRPDISMKVTICGAGLRAVTREHGLTEYWAHRVTYCAAHPAYPRVFCWVYRHEGRRLKQELRCHAVLCPKQGKAETMATQLQERLCIALHEFRREKIIRQNARLSVVNAVYDTTSVPLRKFYLVNGASNYRPPLERSKSAPKLGAIEEILGEEEEEEMEEEMHINRRGKEKSPSTPLVSSSSHFDELLKRLRHPAHLVTPNGASPGEVAMVYQHIDESPVEVHYPPGEVVTFSSPDLMYYSSRKPPDEGEVPGFNYHNGDPGSNYHNGGRLNTHEEEDFRQLLKSFNKELALSTEGLSNARDSLIGLNGEEALIGLTHEETLIGLRNREEALIGLTNGEETLIGITHGEEALIGLRNREETLIGLRNRDESLIGLTNGEESLNDLSNGVESLTSDQPESIGSHSCSSSSCDGSGDQGCDGDEMILSGGEILSGGGILGDEVRGKGKGLEEEDNISEESGYSEDKDCIAVKV